MVLFVAVSWMLHVVAAIDLVKVGFEFEAAVWAQSVEMMQPVLCLQWHW